MTVITLPQDALCLNTEFAFPLAHRKTINSMCERISAVGLLNPLVVTKVHGRYHVVDGKKRLHAIKKLARRNKLPRTLHKVPCVLSDQNSIHMTAKKAPLLLSEQDLAQGVLQASKEGSSNLEISAKFDCSEKVVAQALSLKQLNSKLTQAFFHQSINLAQAAALATIPNPQAQWDLLVQLGPFATEPEIIQAISSGQTVLELPNGETLLLPSRAAKAQPAEPTNVVELFALDMAA